MLVLRRVDINVIRLRKCCLRTLFISCSLIYMSFKERGKTVRRYRIDARIRIFLLLDHRDRSMMVEKRQNGKNTMWSRRFGRQEMYCRDRKRETRFGGVTNMGRTRWETTLKKRTGLVDPRGRNWFRIRIRITRPFRNRSRVHIRSRPRRIDPPHDHSYGKRASFILTTLNLLFHLLLFPFPDVSPFSALRSRWKNINYVCSGAFYASLYTLECTVIRQAVWGSVAVPCPFKWFVNRRSF